MNSLVRGPLALVSLALLAGACAGAGTKNPDGAPNGVGGYRTDAKYDRPPPPPPSCGTSEADKCTNFPTDPIIDTGVTGDPAASFTGTPDTSGGPCIQEPEDGALYPNNWARPRIRWEGGAAGTLTKLIFECERETNPLVVYTTAHEWKMDSKVWNSLRQTVQDTPDQTSLASWINVTVWPQGGKASTTRFLIAPVDAAGSMVFWAAKGEGLWADPNSTAALAASWLEGFKVGDEGTAKALSLQGVGTGLDQAGAMQSWDCNNERPVKCIGCHTSTPDGRHVGFVDHWEWPTVIAAVDPAIGAGKPFADMTEGGKWTLHQPWQGPPTFSRAHWQPGDYRAIVPWAATPSNICGDAGSAAPAELAWIDVAGPAVAKGGNGKPWPALGTNYGILARTGDPHTGAAFPAWSHDGTTVLYASTQGGNKDGRLEKGATDLYTIPYAGGAGGPATPVPGASTPENEEYYPSWSPDDELIAFTRIPAGGVMYANDLAEIAVTRRSDGQTVRLAANDPPACSGKTSPGVNNHWPKWSPEVKSFGNRTYYWIIFSSNRRTDLPLQQGNNHTAKTSQLYMTGVMVDEMGVRAFPSVYLWNQSTETINTTPAWDTFVLPPVE